MSGGMPGVVQMSAPGWPGSGIFVGFLPGAAIAASASGRLKYLLSWMVASTLRLTRSMLVGAPPNSQVKRATRPSVDKSAGGMRGQRGGWTRPGRRGGGIALGRR